MSWWMIVLVAFAITNAIALVTDLFAWLWRTKQLNGHQEVERNTVVVVFHILEAILGEALLPPFLFVTVLWFAPSTLINEGIEWVGDIRYRRKLKKHYTPRGTPRLKDK